MIEYHLIRSKRKTIALTVTRGLEVVVRAPLRMSHRDIGGFVERHSSWIKKQLERGKELTENVGTNNLTEAQISELIQKAKLYLPQRTAYFSDVMGVVPSHVKITSARTRWGSCSGKNGICFSYHVMRLPVELIDCIIVHELAHIRVKDHSDMFYHEILKYMPDYQDRAKKLRRLYK